MEYQEINKFFQRTQRGELKILFYRGFKCYIKQISFHIDNIGAKGYWRVSLEGEHPDSETGLVKWRTIYKDVEYYPSKSVEFIMED